MPLRPFVFENTSNETSNDRNWRIFTEGSKTVTYQTLSVTNPVVTPTVPYATFTLYGPIVYYSIRLNLDDGDGWTTSSYIDMPFPVHVNTDLTVSTAHLGQVFFWNTGAVITTASFMNNNFPTRLFFAGAYTNTSGITQNNIFIQGWYYRG